MTNNPALVVWITGLSGAGKTTIAKKMQQHMEDSRTRSMILDGDDLRSGINSDLGFSTEDRTENIRRAAEMAKIFSQNKIITFCSLISPLRDQRSLAKEIIGRENFIEVYANCPIEVCAQRDTKGLYKKAIQGQMDNFTGISMDYEAPEDPDLEIDSSILSVEESCAILLRYLVQQNHLFLFKTGY